MHRTKPRVLQATSARARRRDRQLPFQVRTEALESRVLLSAGDLDRSFSGDGKLFVPDNVFHRTGEDVALQSDGKAVIVGSRAASVSAVYSSLVGPADVIVARRNADLTPDATFGSGGEVRVDLGGDDAGRSVAVDSLGRILVGATTRGPAGTTWTVLRYLPGGTPDSTFGTGGRVSFLGAPTYLGLMDMEVAPTGRIVAAGATPEGPFSVVAFTPSGQLDASFGGDGVVAVDFGFGLQQDVMSIATMADGRVVAAGFQSHFQGPGSTNPVLVARLNADGALDSTFDGDGKVVDIRAHPVALDAAVDGDGRVVLAGSFNGGNGFVMRRTSAGAPDTSFGFRGGVVLITTGGPFDSNSLRSVAVTPGGDVTVAGTVHYDFLVAHVTAAGLFTSWVTHDFYSATDRGAAVALTPEGDAVVAGTVAANDFTTYGLARFGAPHPGDPVIGVGADAHGAGPFEGAWRRVYDTVVQPDRKVVVAGTAASGPDFNFFLARYNPDGSLDPAFDGDGIAAADFGADRNDEARALVLQSDGRIVAAGSSRLRVPPGQHPTNDIAVARFNTDGSLDTSFGGGDGRVLTDLGRDALLTDADAYPGGGFVVSVWSGVVRYTASGELDPTFAGDGLLDVPGSPQAVLVQGDKVVVAVSGTVERYNADGTRDTTFTGPSLAGPYSHLNDLALAGDGDVVVLGTRNDYDEDGVDTHDLVVWRLNGEGTLDTDFGTGGRAIVLFPGFSKSEFNGELAVQPDGKIVAAASGTLSDLRGSYDWVNAVVRLTPGGSPDPEFGLGGTAFEFIPLEPSGMALDSSGDIVVAGNSESGLRYGVYRVDGTGGGPSASIDREKGLVIVRGSSGDDSIRVSVRGGRLVVYLNETFYTFTRTSSRRVMVHGGDGNDTIIVSSAVPNMQVFGGGGDDTLRGSPGFDWLDGGAGNDTLDGGLGRDVLTGGEGADSLDYRSRTADVTVRFYYDDDYYPERLVRVGGQQGENDVLLDYFEKVYGGAGNDTLHAHPVGGAVYGGGGADTLHGGFGPDALWGDAGDDTLVNSGGADYLRGGAGNDTVSYSLPFNFDSVTVTIDGKPNDGRAGEGDNVFTDVENVVGGFGNDRITGSGANNRLDGGHGNDTLAGAGGNDTLIGGQGDDTLTDTQGNNTFEGGTGTDTFNGVTEPHESDLLEVEDARLSGVRVGSDQGGYTGRGYGDYGPRSGDYIEFTYFSAAAGPRTLSFRYANGSTADRPLELRLNSAVVQPALSFPPTGTWRTWRTVEVTVNLVAGLNTIRLTSTALSGGNIDSMTIV